MSISDRWLKKGVEAPRCPMCRTLLVNGGDVHDYSMHQKYEISTCPNCIYERKKLVPWD